MSGSVSAATKARSEAATRFVERVENFLLAARHLEPLRQRDAGDEFHRDEGHAAHHTAS
jgi:hypothetical protein